MSVKPKTVFLILGSNVGKRRAMVEKAKFLLKAHCGPIIKESSMYVTEPWGEENQAEFINQVIQLETYQNCRSLLESCQRIEEHLGKYKTSTYGPRKIDIDILFYNNKVINEEDLIVPHPRLHERNFVLDPLSEIAAEYIHPIFNVSIDQLKQDSSDICRTEKLTH